MVIERQSLVNFLMITSQAGCAKQPADYIVSTNDSAVRTSAGTKSLPKDFPI